MLCQPYYSPVRSVIVLLCMSDVSGTEGYEVNRT